MGLCSDIIRINTGQSYWHTYFVVVLKYLNTTPSSSNTSSLPSNSPSPSRKGSTSSRSFSTMRISTVLEDIFSRDEVYRIICRISEQDFQ